MKIMHIVRNVEYRGGAEEFVLKLLENQSQNHHVGLCCIEGVGDTAKNLSDLGITLHNIPVDWYYPVNAKIIADIIFSEKYQIVHTHLFNADLVGCIAAKLANVPAVSTKYCMFSRAYETGSLFEKIVTKPLSDIFLEKIVTKLASEIHAVSSEVKAKWEKLSTTPVYVIPCSPREISFGKGNSHKKNKKITLGTLSRLVPEKGIDLGLKIVSQLVTNQYDIEWQIGGDGYLFTNLQHQSQKLGLEPNVKFLGHVANVENFLQQIDIYFHPSRSEGLPIAVQEAMLCSKPIIASNTGGIPDLVINGKNGHLINPYSPVESAKIISPYINSLGLRNSMGKASRDFAIKHFTFNKANSQVEESYERILKK